MIRNFHWVALFLLAGCPICLRSAESGDEGRGFTFYERFQGGVNTLGAINLLDTSAGYNFNSHFGLEGGLPVYFVNPSSSVTASTGATSATGIGNVYGRLRLSVANPIVNFESTVTGTAPTGDKATGFSTGHATVDWSNYFDHRFSSLTPFVDVGIANSVSDTMFFVRPYTTYGLVTHVEGGARYRLVGPLSVGFSGYAIEPSGQQTVISRLVKSQKAAATTPATAPRKGQGVFETSNSTTGSSSIAQDHGLSVWAQLAPTRTLNLYAGYSRSTQYDLDTIFFGVGFNLGRAFRSLGI